MTLGELCELTGLSKQQLAERLGAELGLAEDTIIRKAYSRTVPRHWLAALDLTAPDELDADTVASMRNGNGRESELPPQPPPGARIETPPRPSAPDELDFSAISSYIEGAYKLGAHAVRDSDALLADSIEAHAAPAGQAWAKWVESEPKVAALLRRMMVGTPMGEVIAVHVGIGFSYFLARSAVSRFEREQARAAAAATDAGPAGADGSFEPEPAFTGS